jgi:hypothetical protein
MRVSLRVVLGHHECRVTHTLAAAGRLVEVRGRGEGSAEGEG